MDGQETQEQHSFLYRIAKTIIFRQISCLSQIYVQLILKQKAFQTNLAKTSTSSWQLNVTRNRNCLQNSGETYTPSNYKAKQTCRIEIDRTSRYINIYKSKKCYKRGSLLARLFTQKQAGFISSPLFPPLNTHGQLEAQPQKTVTILVPFHSRLFRSRILPVQASHYSSLGRDPYQLCLLYTSPSPRDRQKSRMPSSA